MSTALRRGPGLSLGQYVIAIAMGIALWFLGALIIGWIAPLGAFDGWGRALTYALLIPGTLPFVLLIKRLARLGDEQVFAGATVATGAAIALDGLAIPYLPGVYGGAPLADAGAVILWGGAAAIALGAMLNRPRSG
ncbi:MULTISPECIES: hypothetical protein [Hyphobacterium]|uniref:Uncharacterized protein n=1 Tax=Hyphobacterium vulgare TaxID=1736751 RepID=A0ABV7A111_9PROT